MPEQVDPEQEHSISKATLAGAGVLVLALVIILIFVPSGNPAAPLDETYPPKIFVQRCVVCHGPGGQGKGPFPRLIGTSKTEAEIEKQLETGKGQMPSFRELSPEVRKEMAKFVKALK